MQTASLMMEHKRLREARKFCDKYYPSQQKRVIRLELQLLQLCRIPGTTLQNLNPQNGIVKKLNHG